MKIVDGVNYTNWSREEFENLKKAKMTFVHVTMTYWEDTYETIKKFDSWDRCFEDNKDIITKIETVDDLHNAEVSGKVGIILGWQNPMPIASDLELLEYFFKRGLRIMQMSYNNQSYIASGCYEDSGMKITRFGREVVKEMNRLGIAIDLSHIHNKSGLDVVELSKKPVCISHSIPSFNKNSQRNISTELMKYVSESGGILGLSLYPLHIKNGSNCTLDEYCKLIEDSTSVMGIDHIGIGSDLCKGHPGSVLRWMRCGKWLKVTDDTDSYFTNKGWPQPLSWFKDIEDINNLINGMRAYGFKEEDIEKVMGLNWIRYMRSILPNSVKKSYKSKIKCENYEKVCK